MWWRERVRCSITPSETSGKHDDVDSVFGLQTLDSEWSCYLLLSPGTGAGVRRCLSVITEMEVMPNEALLVTLPDLQRLTAEESVLGV